MSNIRNYRTDKCLNCEHEIDYSDNFCPRCGQKNSTQKLSLYKLLSEYFAGVFAYDSRLFSSIRLIFSTPGRLSKEFLSGKRVRYVNPFRFFISISIIFFVLVSVLPNVGTDDLSGIVEFSGDMSKGMKDQGNAEMPAEVFETLEENHYLEFDEAIEKYGVEDELTAEVKFYYFRAIYKMKHEPMAFTSYIFSKLPFFVFFFIPIFTLFSWLIYIRRSFSYTDHLVFNYNLNTVFFIVLIISIVLKSIFGVMWINFILLLFFIYLYFAYKRFYGQGYFKTFFKLSLLSFIYTISSITIILIMLAVSVLFF